MMHRMREFRATATRMTVIVASVLTMCTAESVTAFVSKLEAQSTPAVSVAPLPGVDTILDARAKAVASRLRCPVCQGESIQDSPAELAAQMKSLVREQIASGRSEAQVFDYFTAKYGQWILLEPKPEGINLLVYWLPVVFLVVGGGGIAIAVKRWTRPKPLDTLPTGVAANAVATPSVSANAVSPPSL